MRGVFRTILIAVLLILGLGVAFELGTATACRQSQLLSLARLLPHADPALLEELDAQIVRTLRTVLLTLDLGYEKSRILNCRFAALLENLARQGPELSPQTLPDAREFVLDCYREFAFFITRLETFEDYRCARILRVVQILSKKQWRVVSLNLSFRPNGPTAYLDMALYKPEASPSRREPLLALVEYGRFTLDDERSAAYWAKEILRVWKYAPNLSFEALSSSLRVLVYALSRGQDPDLLRILLQEVRDAPVVSGLPLFVLWLDKFSLRWRGTCFGCEGVLPLEAAREIACQLVFVICRDLDFALAEAFLRSGP